VGAGRRCGGCDEIGVASSQHGDTVAVELAAAVEVVGRYQCRRASLRIALDDAAVVDIAGDLLLSILTVRSRWRNRADAEVAVDQPRYCRRYIITAL